MNNTNGFTVYSPQSTVTNSMWIQSEKMLKILFFNKKKSNQTHPTHTHTSIRLGFVVFPYAYVTIVQNWKRQTDYYDCLNAKCEWMQQTNTL